MSSQTSGGPGSDAGGDAGAGTGAGGSRGRTHITGMHAVGVPVTDVDRSLAFYTDVLGLGVRMDVSFGEGQRWVEVAPAGAATGIALVAADDDVPAGVETGIRLTSADAEADHAALRDAGADVDDVLRIPGTPVMYVVRDPDGNRLIVIQS